MEKMLVKLILLVCLSWSAIGFGADNVTLSYAAGSDTLTIDNNSAATPVTWQMIYADGAWTTAGLTNTDHMTEVVVGKVYIIKDNIIFGSDNSNTMNFSSTNEMVYFEDDKKFTTYADANDNLTITFGSVTADGYGYNGSTWSICPTAGVYWGYENSSTVPGTTYTYGQASTVMAIYGSTIINRSTASESNLKFMPIPINGIILKDSVFANTASVGASSDNWYIDSATATVDRCKFHGSASVRLSKAVLRFSDNDIYNSYRGLCAEATITATNPRSSGTNSDYANAVAVTQTILNPTATIVAADIVHDNASSVTKTAYTNTLKITDDNDTAISGASVQHYTRDNNTSPWVWTGPFTTDSGGLTTSDTYAGKMWTGTSETEQQAYNRVVVTKTGLYPFALDNFTVSTSGQILVKSQPYQSTYKKRVGFMLGTWYEKLRDE